jgi:hypothetical protein
LLVAGSMSASSKRPRASSGPTIPAPISSPPLRAVRWS